MWNSSDNVFSESSSFREEPDDEEALRWAALERLPTYARARRGIFKNMVGESKEIDLTELGLQEQKLVLDRLVTSVDEDAERFFDRMRKRFDAVDLEFPKIEVRFQNLKVETFIHVGTRALPTIPNFIINMTEAFLRQLHLYPGRRRKLCILDNVSGIIRPSRLTLLLGPPSSGKTTLLLALAGRLDAALKISLGNAWGKRQAVVAKEEDQDKDRKKKDEQIIPIWWRWYYWANPIAWSLYGLLTSQYGDVKDLVKLSEGTTLVPVQLLLRNVFGYRHDYLGIAGIMVVGFCIMFAVVFAFAVKSFNFQKR
ncbi:ABC-transporter, N-terminal domain [Dillenia turbinata]|uniref:ABC-transporter, N-terminal domain n=1 Tax=Dillenia turbinata TaxID=194707 RepID=A0AAN8W2T9_9MAGN